MEAFSSRSNCSLKRGLPFDAALPILSRNLFFISFAAARVKVTISISSIFAPSETSPITRSTKTVVLPEPAAAATKRFLPREVMTFS